MPAPKELDPSSSPRALLGAELRVARERAGLSQAELGEPLFVSGAFIGQLEAGTRRMHLEYARQIDEILGTDGFFVRNCGAAAKSKYPDHFTAAAEAEGLATAIREYAPQIIPGLLQTEPYARAVCRAYQPTATAEVIDELVTNRLVRAAILDDKTTPLFWCVLDEAVLRRAGEDPEILAGALRHIAALIRAHRVIIQVLPFSAGFHAGLAGTLKLMAFSDAPPLSYVDGLGMGQLFDDPATVAHHTLTYDLLTASALSPRKSLALIESVAEEYEHDQHA
ncbi:helix-turn-helix transcriptional regulator [Streptomyces sp. NBC_00091]|uniref:helix-turn-helix domain-containing protein n=1 Tax=Streptomyces sp. NBC_00091 TaxID=2975648 RepID=UPI0022510BCB|nr:helix-turn-helix transcriptional regulator [Streptomyces sp. NBC_00091]MCX5376842.1 helix-turn-helix transcriptional regulator [Streptomyces sp. NBC_00091]